MSCQVPLIIIILSSLPGSLKSLGNVAPEAECRGEMEDVTRKHGSLGVGIGELSLR